MYHSLELHGTKHHHNSAASVHCYCFVPQRGAKHCDQRVCMSACVIFCLSAHISVFKLHEIFCTCYLWLVAVARSSSDDNAICYVLPVFPDDAMYSQNRASSRRSDNQQDWESVTACFLRDGYVSKLQTTLCLVKFARWKHQSAAAPQRRAALLVTGRSLLLQTTLLCSSQ